MSNLVRLVEKFLYEQHKIDINDIDRLCDALGWRLAKSSGSHHTYHKKNHFPLTVPVTHGSKKIKREYVNKVIQHLRLEEWYEQNRPG